MAGNAMRLHNPTFTALVLSAVGRIAFYPEPTSSAKFG